MKYRLKYIGIFHKNFFRFLCILPIDKCGAAWYNLGRPPTNAAAGIRENFNNAKFWKHFNKLKC